MFCRVRPLSDKVGKFRDAMMLFTEVEDGVGRMACIEVSSPKAREIWITSEPDIFRVFYLICCHGAVHVVRHSDMFCCIVVPVPPRTSMALNLF